MEYGFIIQTLVNHINMVWNHFHEMLHELIGYALALHREGGTGGGGAGRAGAGAG